MKPGVEPLVHTHCTDFSRARHNSDTIEWSIHLYSVDSKAAYFHPTRRYCPALSMRGARQTVQLNAKEKISKMGCASGKRRWLRYSLRSMLLVTLVISAWLAWNVNRASRQRKAVEHLRSLDRSVWISYDFEVGEYGLYVNDAAPPGPDWLRELVGVDFLSDVVKLESGKILDPDLNDVHDLTALKYCRFSHAPITDEGVASLSGNTRLEILDLSGTAITDDALSHLERASKLTVLQLSQTNITDAGLVHLRQFPDLEDLWLGHTKITDEGLKHVRQLTDLVRLNLIDTRVTDEGLTHIEELPKLVQLDLGSTDVADGAAPILTEMTQLEELNLYDTKMSAEAIRSVRESLPHTLIRF